MFGSVRKLVLILSAACIPTMAVIAQPAAQGAGSGAATEAALHRGEGREVAVKLADELLRFFPVSAQARSYSTMLRRNAASGRYDSGTRESLAHLLTNDLMAVHKDGHLKIFAADPADRDGPPSPPKTLPPAIQSAKWIAPGIAYIRTSAFLQREDEIEAFHRFMEEHRNARTVIFDLRNNHGGGNAESDIVFSYLFAQKTPLTRLEISRAAFDESGWPFPVTPTLEITEDAEKVTATRYALPGEKTPLRSARVLVLVSNRTQSAAEGFAVALQSTGRATLIGEATAGANHFGGPRAINEDLGVWMPIGRSFDVRTGKDWEGVGVAPDMKVEPKRALVVALERAGLSHAEAVRLDAEEVPAEPVHADKLPAR